MAKATKPLDARRINGLRRELLQAQSALTEATTLAQYDAIKARLAFINRTLAAYGVRVEN